MSSQQTPPQLQSRWIDIAPRLHPRSHLPNDLKTYALAYLDRDLSLYTAEQRAAVDKLKNFCNREDAKTDIGSEVYLAVLQDFIPLVGTILFPGGMEGVTLLWSDEGYDQGVPVDAMAITLIVEEGEIDGQTGLEAGEYIIINTSHSHWVFRSYAKGWRVFLGNLVHEIIHAFFNRHRIMDSEYGATGHHAACQLVAEAAERRLRSNVGLRVRLHRERALVFEYQTAGSTDLTEDELQICFGVRRIDKIWYLYVQPGQDLSDQDSTSWSALSHLSSIGVDALTAQGSIGLFHRSSVWEGLRFA